MVRKLESVSRKIISDDGFGEDHARVIAAFFTSPHLKTDVSMAFEEACDSVGITGRSPAMVSIRIDCEEIVRRTVAMSGFMMDVSSIDPISRAFREERREDE